MYANVSARHCNLQNIHLWLKISCLLRSDERTVIQINLCGTLCILQGTLLEGDLCPLLHTLVMFFCGVSEVQYSTPRG